MKRTTLSTSLYVLLVFLSGAVVGGFAHRLYMVNTVSAKPDEYRRKYMDEMRARLSLSSDQVAQINSILDSTKARYHEVKEKWDKDAREKAKPELKAIHDDQVQKVKAILSETQRAGYDQLRAEREKLRQKENSNKPAAR